MKKIFSAALALVCIWFATPARANCNLFDSSVFNTDVGYETTFKQYQLPNGTYTMSTNFPSQTGSRYTNVWIIAGKQTTGQSSDINGVSSDYPRTITVTDGWYTIFYRSTTASIPRNPKDYNWQLERGTTATPYTPYNPLCATCDGTVVSGRWNQLVQNGNFADGVNNWISETSVVANAENGVLSVTYQSSGDRGVGQVVEIGSGHKVFVSFDVDSYTGESYIGVFRGSNNGSMFRSVGDAVKIDRTGHYEQVRTLMALSDGFDYYTAGAGRPVGEGVTVSFSNLNVIDLTEMFGAGNEPSTVQEAKAAIAQRANELGISATNGYYAYHANENMSSCISKIKIATTKYNETAFGPLNTALANAISVVDTVVSNTITQAASIATLQAQKQTRPNDIADDSEKCPAGKKCLLVEDASGVPHWYEIVERYSLLPDGYTELQWIESTGTQYIDTGLNPKPDVTSVEFELAITDTSIEQIFGARQTSSATAGSYNIFANVSPNQFRFDWAGGSGVGVDGVVVGTFYKFVLNADGSVDFQNEHFGSAATKVACDYNMYLFGGNSAGTTALGKVRYKGAVKIKERGTLVRDFVPAKNASGVVGMYDTVEGRFYTNAGTGEFVAGPVAE